jgi:hypothetical protein
MNRVITSVLFTTSLALAAPSVSYATGFDTTITSPLAGAVKVEVRLSKDLAYRADNLPEKLSDRSSGGGRSTAFSDNGFYGERDLVRLQTRLEERLVKQLTKRGVSVSDTASTVLRVTLDDAKNNRPTFRQLGKDPGLSYQSFGRGGAEIEAELLRAGGNAVGTMSYEWYEDDIRDARYGGTWSDAHRAIDRFAKKAAKTLATSSQS